MLLKFIYLWCKILLYHSCLKLRNFFVNVLKERFLSMSYFLAEFDVCFANIFVDDVLLYPKLHVSDFSILPSASCSFFQPPLLYPNLLVPVVWTTRGRYYSHEIFPAVLRLPPRVVSFSRWSVYEILFTKSFLRYLISRIIYREFKWRIKNF